MARLNLAALVYKIDSLINTNGTQSITGAIANVVLKDIVATSYIYLPYDPLLQYFAGEMCSYDNGDGLVLWQCNTDTTGTFTVGHWTTLSSPGNYIPLAGTAVGANVTGNIRIDEDFGIYGYDDGLENFYNSFVPNKNTGSGNAAQMQATDDGSYYANMRFFGNGANGGRMIIGNSYISGFVGLEYESDYSAKFTSARSIPDRGYNDTRYMQVSTYIDGGTGKIAAAYLPGFVDDVLEYADFAALPGTGETGKMYVTLDNGKIHRWSGSAYVEISASPGTTDAVTEGVTNLYYTNARVLTAMYSGGTALTSTHIPYSNGSTLAGTASLTWVNNLQQLNIGSGSNPFGYDFNLTKNLAGGIYASIANDHANGIAGLVIGKDSGEYLAIQKYAPSRASNFNGTSIPFADLTTFVTSKAYALNSVPMLIGASVLYNVTGTTSTNAATRLDSVGYRIGTLADIHNANTARFELPAGSATVSPLKLNAGTNKTSPVSGDIEFDGTNVYYTDSTPTRQTLVTNNTDEYLMSLITSFRFLTNN